ncbi:ArsR/SmtB family transcription factor [Virgibacillus oceani]|uniref:Transcriptional regulator n=1 Tax=Virgibacillus oceani TaxID=1479511 RepID=A0A917M876_9BACI|nr:metalloregulator ArsR/SmtB family transcription factor [Virgibacillus oceani]GGG83759.1 transcriptional regulator [Virgibacillus oceani]
MRNQVKSISDTCDVSCYNEEVVENIQPEVKRVEGVELLFKALSDATRLKVAYALTLEEELCVCDVANIIRSSNATASHHLRTLKNMNIATIRRDGKRIFYSLVDEHIHQLVNIALIHAEED